MLPNGVEPRTGGSRPWRATRGRSSSSASCAWSRASGRSPCCGGPAPRAGRCPAACGCALVLVGEGPLRARVERDVRRHGRPRTSSCPAGWTGPAIRELYRRADVYIAPATLESFGIAALEARCAGLPVLARRRTGIADFIADGVEGLLARNDRGLARELAPGRRRTPNCASGSPSTTGAVRPEAGWGEVLQRCELAYKAAAELSPGRRVPARH